MISCLFTVQNNIIWSNIISHWRTVGCSGNPREAHSNVSVVVLCSEVSDRGRFFNGNYSLPWHTTLGTAKEQVTNLGKSNFAFWNHHIHVPSPGPTVIAWKETLCRLPTAVQGMGMQGRGIRLGLQLNNFIFYQISKAEVVFCITFNSFSR